MMTVVFVGCSSNIACSVRRSVPAKARVAGLGKGWFSTASLQLCRCKLMYGKGSPAIGCLLWYGVVNNSTYSSMLFTHLFVQVSA